MNAAKESVLPRASFIKRMLGQAEETNIPLGDGVSLLSDKGLNVYQGPWGEMQVLQLLRRCLFGVKQEELKRFAALNMDQCLNELFAPSATPAPPINAYNGSIDTNNKTKYSDPTIAPGMVWVNAPYGPLRPGLAYANRQNPLDEIRRLNLKGWWAGLMLNQQSNLTEKMVLFWHSAISTQMKPTKDARYSYRHLTLLRRYALGNFKQLIRDVTIDPQMLVYLNGNKNTASAPNENYARELQELFTAGKSPGVHFTEEDVRSVASLLSGWVDNFTSPESTEISSSFLPDQHDTKDKHFSAFYKNTVITGRAGADGARELDDLVDMIFRAPQTAKTLCRKLYRFFVYYEIDDKIEKNVIEPLAQILIASNFETGPVLKALFSSEHFYSTQNTGCLIKNPVDLVVGMMRQFNMLFPDSQNYVLLYAAWTEVALMINDAGMDIGDPPEVAGWPAYYRAPDYHRLWLNSSTLPNRNAIPAQLLKSKELNRKGVNLKLDYMKFTRELPNPGDPDKLIAESVKLLSPVPFDTVQFDYVKCVYLLSGDQQESYWTKTWNNYIKNPADKETKDEVEDRLLRYYTYLLSRAEFQMI